MTAACARCGGTVNADEWRCDGCGAATTVIDGFVSYAPDQASSSESFDVAAFDDLAELEAGSFWFTSRNHLITWAARRYFPEATSIHEVGCGTGFVLAALRRAYPAARVSGSELHIEGLRHAASRVPSEVDLYQLDARQMPFRGAFDLIGVFDVLEHVDEDSMVLASIRAALRPGGGLLITVPQHARLWSPQDDFAHHRRRYGAADLHGKVQAAGFRILRSTSFVTLLLPAMLLSRRLPSRGRERGVRALRVAPIVDRSLRPILAFERGMIRAGISLPIGGSRIVVAVAAG